jgi:hypothetical protein
MSKTTINRWLDNTSKVKLDTAMISLSDVVGSLAQDVDGVMSDVYNKSEVYPRSDVDVLLSDKPANGDVYTRELLYQKSETDALLDDKADRSDVYTKAQSDVLSVPKAPSWGRMLVGYMKIRYSSSGIIENRETPFNLRCELSNNPALIKFLFEDSKPVSDDYVIIVESNVDIKRLGTKDKNTARFYVEVDDGFDPWDVFTVCVYHNNMRVLE